MRKENRWRMACGSVCIELINDYYVSVIGRRTIRHQRGMK